VTVLETVWKETLDSNNFFKRRSIRSIWFFGKRSFATIENVSISSFNGTSFLAGGGGGREMGGG